MNLSLAFSPCANDTFIFDSLVHQKIKTDQFTFDVSYLDVQQLNLEAQKTTFDITKLSYFAASQLLDKYQILSAGGALGFGCGPLLISKNTYETKDVPGLKIAIPGKNTTAFFLLQYSFPKVVFMEEYLFSEIEDAVMSGKVDAGLIIHENRFTYEEKGLRKIIDLGEYWEQKTGHPIPLGCIAIKRSLPENVKTTINELIKKSVQYAWDNPISSREYVKCYSQELEDEVIQSHIDLYVNKFSADLGEEGKKAVLNMFGMMGLHEEKLNPEYIFVP